jgi:hypothetical protein
VSTFSAARCCSRAALVFAAAVLAGCLPIDPPDGALTCAAPPNECPPGYACGPDKTCRRPSVMNGSTDMAAGGDDLRAPADLALPPNSDLAIVCPPGGLYCDDFETGNFDRWTAEFLGPPHPSKILKNDTTEVHAGTHALHAAVDNTTDNSYLYVAWQFAAMNPPLALRMWVKPMKALSKSGMVTRLLNGANGFQVGGDNNGYWFVAQDIGTSPEAHSTTPIGLSQWTCLELVVNSRVQVFVDDSVSPIIDFVPAHPVAYNEVHVGVEWAPQGVPVDVWIDDVAFGTSRLHCQ